MDWGYWERLGHVDCAILSEEGYMNWGYWERGGYGLVSLEVLGDMDWCYWESRGYGLGILGMEGR